MYNATLAGLFCAKLCFAEAVEFPMGRLVGPDAWLVSGVNVERLESAPIAKWQPSEEMWLPSSFESILAGRTKQIFHMELGKEGES